MSIKDSSTQPVESSKSHVRNPHFNHQKYKAFPAKKLPDRTWPDKELTQAPTWCSVDLRDGNQALIEPMSVEQKFTLFKLLVKLGFKEIEVGFPAASQTDFDFVRFLIEGRHIPDGVSIQVLTQAREHLIKRTYESLDGCKDAIVHVYNSTSIVQREKVFKLSKEGIKEIAVNGAQCVLDESKRYPHTRWRFEYSPESFTGTEVDYALEVCHAVLDVWQPTADRKAIINLPSTVEMTSPNVFADQIEYFVRNFKYSDTAVISLHTHNDRGCGIAAAELGMMAGAMRIEGTLLGNGERSGNMDIVNLAMNLYSQGVDPELVIDDIDEIVHCVQSCTNIRVHPRHPYAGDLVYTSFSGSHQDAIRKCLSDYEPGALWEIAYLPIDPQDVGRSYEAVIRVNSQSGKGGVTYILEKEYGLQIPRALQIDVSRVIQSVAEKEGGEISVQTIGEVFHTTYAATQPLELKSYQISQGVESTQDTVVAEIAKGDEVITVRGEGSGALEAFESCVRELTHISFEFIDFSEHAMTKGSRSTAMAYVQIKHQAVRAFGVAEAQDIVKASFQALLSAVNLLEKRIV